MNAFYLNYYREIIEQTRQTLLLLLLLIVKRNDVEVEADNPFIRSFFWIIEKRAIAAGAWRFSNVLITIKQIVSPPPIVLHNRRHGIRS